MHTLASIHPAQLTPTPDPAPPIAPPHLDPGAAAADAVAWALGRPWLLGALALIAVSALTLVRVVANLRHLRQVDGARQVTIAPPPQVDPAGAGVFWANLAGILRPARIKRLRYGTPHVVFEYLWVGRRLTISVWVPGTVPPGAVEAAARAAWPGAAVTTTDEATDPLPAVENMTAVGGQLALSDAEWLPISTDHDADPLRPLIAAAGRLRDDEHAVVQVLARPASPRRYARARRAAGRLRAGKPAASGVDLGAPIRGALDIFLPGPPTSGRAATAGPRHPGVDRDVRAILEKSSGQLWQAGIRYAVAAVPRGGTAPSPDRREQITRRLGGIGSAVASAFAVYSARNQLARRLRLPHPVRAVADRRLGAGFLLGTPELAVLAGLPQDLAVPGLDRARAKAMPAPVEVPTGGRDTKPLGLAEVGGHKVALRVADSRYHTHMVGQTGSGKSTLLARQIIADINAYRGTVVIDPHGDLITDVLERLDPKHADRVVLFDPDQPNPPALNPLDGSDHDLMVDNIVAIFSSIFSKAWGPRMDDVMRVSCLTLLRHSNVTLQHIPPLLNSPQFRAEMTADLDDPDGLDGFWQWYDAMTPALRSQVIGPVLSRLRSFLLRDFVKRTMKWPKSSFDMGKILDGGILLVRIPKGVLGEDTSKLLGSLILARVWQAATARASLPPEKRRDASIYLDEAQNFLTLAGSLDTMLAEARKYRLAMTLAHQDLAQFPRELLAAVSANARNKVFFSVAPEDARVLARHTMPELDDHDLTHLDAYTAVTRLVVDARQTAPFTMKTLPPAPVVGAVTAIRQSAASRVPTQHRSAVDGLVERAARKEAHQKERARRERQDPVNGT
ncbi:hypothetical protein GCM10010124_31530 [Pilimelia terevasa]|uniref:Type IV secretion system coupling protein TraD DNA-binding domain-containing protein n=1 Tax=Pilimelia terevasa TaxID=53372 RepID=A0A8J3FJ26_9ACTN|nr:DUF87 domain-containing protein [Pilimelia terevasa]GGK36559.1 hypothetical protein GCM10010124_31530 [Pilimelia terevasa]